MQKFDPTLQNAYISLTEAARGTPYSQEYLSLRARQGELKAVKIGRNWVTLPEWVEEYITQKAWAQKKLSYSLAGEKQPRIIQNKEAVKKNSRRTVAFQPHVIEAEDGAKQRPVQPPRHTPGIIRYHWNLGWLGKAHASMLISILLVLIVTVGFMAISFGAAVSREQYSTRVLQWGKNVHNGGVMFIKKVGSELLQPSDLVENGKVAGERIERQSATGVFYGNLKNTVENISEKAGFWKIGGVEK